MTDLELEKFKNGELRIVVDCRTVEYVINLLHRFDNSLKFVSDESLVYFAQKDISRIARYGKVYLYNSKEGVNIIYADINSKEKVEKRFKNFFSIEELEITEIKEGFAHVSLFELNLFSIGIAHLMIDVENIIPLLKTIEEYDSNIKWLSEDELTNKLSCEVFNSKKLLGKKKLYLKCEDKRVSYGENESNEIFIIIDVRNFEVILNQKLHDDMKKFEKILMKLQEDE